MVEGIFEKVFHEIKNFAKYKYISNLQSENVLQKTKIKRNFDGLEINGPTKMSSCLKDFKFSRIS